MTGGGLWFTGDVISQLVEGGEKEFDWKRTARMTTYGFCIAGPLYCWWYRFLDKRTVGITGWNGWKVVGVKILADQTVFELPYLATFFTISTLMEGKTLKDVEKKLRKEYLPTYMVDCTVWPVAQAINFRLLPVTYQAAYVNAICVGWNGFLSYVHHRQDPETKTIAVQDAVEDNPE